MPRSLVPLLLLSSAALGPGLLAQQGQESRALLARVDPRVELLSIVFRLAGNPEYCKGRVPGYSEAVDRQFGKFADHRVVAHARQLRGRRGVSYDAVMSMAVHIDLKLQPLVPFDKAERLDSRWPRKECQPFLDELRDFAKVSSFDEFVKQQTPLYELTAQRAQKVLDDEAKLAWFDGFFGTRATAQFEFCLGMLNGGGCYGPSALVGKQEQLYCILGVWQTDADGNPTFDKDMIGTVVHEFCHSYCNPLVDAHLKELEPAGVALWPFVETEMRQQAYGSARTMLCESLVRACVVRYQLANVGEQAAKQEVQEQLGRSFLWTGELQAALGEYEVDRQHYPTLDPFMPKVAATLLAFAKDYVAEQQLTPKVVHMMPASGDTKVDPGLKAIVITFDRPMRDGAWAVVGGGEHFPKVGKPFYDGKRTTLTIPVELQPEWDYEFWLNRGKYNSFQSEDGHRLRPVHVTFRTAK